MATPAERVPRHEHSTDLRLVHGGLAVKQSVEVAPVLPQPFSEFATTLDEDSWANMTAEQLLAIRERISEYRGDIALLIHSLQQQHDAALGKQIWINGFIRDRQ